MRAARGTQCRLLTFKFHKWLSRCCHRRSRHLCARRPFKLHGETSKTHKSSTHKRSLKPLCELDSVGSKRRWQNRREERSSPPLNVPQCSFVSFDVLKLELVSLSRARKLPRRAHLCPPFLRLANANANVNDTDTCKLARVSSHSLAPLERLIFFCFPLVSSRRRQCQPCIARGMEWTHDSWSAPLDGSWTHSGERNLQARALECELNGVSVSVCALDPGRK